MPDMRQRDLKPCSGCGKGVMHQGIPIFYVFRMDTMGVDADAVQQQHGMELMMGGGVQGATLAHVMGPDPALAKQIDSKDIVLCHGCMMDCNAGTFIGGD